MGAFFVIGSKLITVFEPIPKLDGFLRIQIPKCDSHRSSDHHGLRMHVANERFVLLESVR